ncbi:aldolase [Thozetella sp. PMI_491]|nr:aldolase [Thozetella sp. PMI_491]
MAQKTNLTGISVALITPFTADQSSIDVPALHEHVNRLIALGVNGIVPGGSTGEFTTLSTEERKQLVEETVRAAAGRVPVVAGIGELSTSKTVDLARHAASAGASAVMVVPPFYDALNLEQLREYFSEINSASGLPIMYYHIPSASGVNLSPSELASLSEVGVKYMKDTSGNAPALTELLFDPAIREKITCFNGWDTLTFYGLAAGAKGSVFGATNFIPELSQALWEAVSVQHDLKKGREVWEKMFPILKFLESHNYASAVKTGMELRGWKTGGLRKPFKLLEGDLRTELAGLLRRAGVEVVE